ncbi:hypothetical protein PGIGA_G00001540 [Pangasianodon gigas]|uniref:Uncharacterized protein n=1 Tax=Pangasianodon gigas TaxID=30993 RepID=A0ACC5W5D7_PANGG|nr:hypothetical protein [Pangasianodon gigas]
MGRFWSYTIKSIVKNIWYMMIKFFPTGGIEARTALQALQRDDSDTSSDSNYEHYYNPDFPPPTTVNNCEQNDTLMVGDCDQEQGRFCEERNAVQIHALDSESTSSGECYEKIETETENILNPGLVIKLSSTVTLAPACHVVVLSKIDCNAFVFIKAVNQFYPEHCMQMTPLHNTSEPAKIDSVDSFDSDSTSSGECYENTGVNAEPCFQTLDGEPSLPEQPPLSHPKPQMAGNSSVSQPYSPDHAHDLDSESTSSGEFYENTETETENLLNPAVNQCYPEHCIQMTPLHNTSEPAKSDSVDSFDSDSTSSGECYENTGVNAEPCFQTLEGNPSLPEQPPLSHPKPQMAGNSSVSQPYSPDQDDSSTSSEEAYENVAEVENFFAKSEQSVHSSTDSDYDDVSNW